MIVRVTTHYEEDDTDFSGDYLSVDIDIDGVLAENYGDYYHDKGKEKVKGFLDCLKYLEGKGVVSKVKVIEESIADGEF